MNRTEKIFSSLKAEIEQQELNVFGIVLYSSENEKYINLWSENKRRNIFSAAKTFVSIAIGICVDEGRLTLEDSILEFFSEYKPYASSGTEKITVRNLLQMASGKAIHRFPKDISDTDYALLFLRESLTNEPGTVFYYSNACSYMLGRIIEKVTGNTLCDYLIPKVFNKLGILNPEWSTCPQGHTMGATGLALTTEELARLGVLLMNGGSYHGQNIVSNGYIKSMTTDCICAKELHSEYPKSMADYGYHIWVNGERNIYWAWGKQGQYCIVVPWLNLVISVTARLEPDSNAILDTIMKLI